MDKTPRSRSICRVALGIKNVINGFINGTANGLDAGAGIIRELQQLKATTKDGSKSVVDAVKKVENATREREGGAILDALEGSIGRDSYLGAF